MLNKTQYGPTTREHDPGGSRSTLSHLSSELARIEGLTLAGHCDADHALEAVLCAIASLEQVCAVDVAIAAEGDFVSVASSGVERLAGTRDHLSFYADCVATGRQVRCPDTSVDPRAHSIPFASMIITPLSAHGDLIGVLAVYANEPSVFGHDHILPLSTAAVICSFLAPQVMEAKMCLNDTQIPSEIFTEPKSLVEKADLASEVETAQSATNSAPSREHTVGHQACPNLSRGSALSHDDAASVAREEAIRSILPEKPGNVFANIQARPTTIKAAVTFLRRPSVIAALLLLLSSVVFGSMQMLRRSGSAASNTPKPAAATRSVTVTKLLGVPRPMRGNTVPADAQVTIGRLIQDGLPAYPPDALARAVQGDVTAILLVSERGTVQDVRVTGGDTLLSNSVLSSLSHWRFAPFEVKGHAIPVEVPVIVAFHINAKTASPLR